MRLSFEQIRELIGQALGRGYWVMDLYPDKAVVSDEMAQRFFQVEYTIGEGGEVSLGDRTEVKREVVYVALNFELPTDGSVPTEIELIQAGVDVVGRDGRAWVNDDPAGVVAALNARGVDLVVDFEHATELKAPNGDQAPAAGWVKDFEVREDGSLWGRVSWTPRGQEAVANREYRYLSPVLIYEKGTGRIRSLSSVGLVNKPNLFNKALNFEQREEVPMDWKKLLAKLGLPEDATLEQALNAIGKLQGDLQTALNRAETPSLDKFVPRADFDQMKTRALNAEQKLADHDKAETDKAINAEVDAAVQAGKIAPASKEFYLAACRQEGGLENFKKFVETAPVIGDPAKLKQHPGSGDVALNAEQQRIAGMFGNSPEDLKKYGQQA